MTVSETADSMRAGLDMLLAAVHADDPKREILVRVGDLMRDVKSLTAALSEQVVVPERQNIVDKLYNDIRREAIRDCAAAAGSFVIGEPGISIPTQSPDEVKTQICAAILRLIYAPPPVSPAGESR